ncbi:peroxiredoxin [Candidatus Nanohalococcus occultus]|uniref:peroxiredoxin n=1 Tax=Candidatus Nanohalococcus occultus TaxID=2978047 RepID=UPI0039E19F7B
MKQFISRIKKAFSSSPRVEEIEKLPGFELKNQDGELVNSKDIENALIYFYPKSGTSGCTKQACGLRDSIEEFNELGIDVYGVSTDPIEKQKEFHEENNLEFDILADPEGLAAERFGVLTKAGFAERTSFLVKNGEIVEVFRKVDPESHVKQVLECLD